MQDPQLDALQGDLQRLDRKLNDVVLLLSPQAASLATIPAPLLSQEPTLTLFPTAESRNASQDATAQERGMSIAKTHTQTDNALSRRGTAHSIQLHPRHQPIRGTRHADRIAFADGDSDDLLYISAAICE